MCHSGIGTSFRYYTAGDPYRERFAESYGIQAAFWPQAERIIETQRRAEAADPAGGGEAGGGIRDLASLCRRAGRWR